MKKALIAWTLFLFTGVIFAQIPTMPDSLSSVKAADSTVFFTKNSKEEIPDTIPAVGYNKYGDLLNDDPVYNRRSPIAITATRVALANVLNWAADRYLFNYEWARINPHTWKNNLKGGWE